MYLAASGCLGGITLGYPFSLVIGAGQQFFFPLLPLQNSSINWQILANSRAGSQARPGPNQFSTETGSNPVTLGLSWACPKDIGLISEHEPLPMTLWEVACEMTRELCLVAEP